MIPNKHINIGESWFPGSRTVWFSLWTLLIVTGSPMWHTMKENTLKHNTKKHKHIYHRVSSATQTWRPSKRSQTPQKINTVTVEIYLQNTFQLSTQQYNQNKNYVFIKTPQTSGYSNKINITYINNRQTIYKSIPSVGTAIK